MYFLQVNYIDIMIFKTFYENEIFLDFMIKK